MDTFFNSVMTPPTVNNFTPDPRIRYEGAQRFPLGDCFYRYGNQSCSHGSTSAVDAEGELVEVGLEVVVADTVRIADFHAAGWATGPCWFMSPALIRARLAFLVPALPG